MRLVKCNNFSCLYIDVILKEKHFFLGLNRQNCRNYTVIVLNSAKNTNSKKKTEPKTKKTKGMKLINQSMEEYFKPLQLASLKDSLTPKLLTEKHKVTEPMYLFKKSTAKKIIESVKSCGGFGGDDIFIEINPGLGFITKHLLSLNVPVVKAFEKDPFFKLELKKLKQEYSSRLELHEINLNNFSRLSFLDSLDSGSRFRNVMKGLVPQEWKEKPHLKVIGAISDMQFLRYLAMRIVFQTDIITYGRPEAYLIINPMIYHTITPVNNYMSSLSVLCRLFFDVELLTTLCRKDYLPWIKNEKRKTLDLIFRELDFSELYLVKVTPKKDLFDRIGGLENLKPLWFFTRMFCKSGNKLVIAEIEKWTPGCGYRLIPSNIHPFTLFEDLNHEKILQLFLEFVQWPEFKDSSFTDGMDALLSKIEVYPEAVLEKENSEESVEETKSTGPFID